MNDVLPAIMYRGRYLCHSTEATTKNGKKINLAVAENPRKNWRREWESRHAILATSIKTMISHESLRTAISYRLSSSAVTFAEFRGIAGSFSAMALEMVLDVGTPETRAIITYILNWCSSGIRAKERANAEKHDVTFDEAVTIFLDRKAHDGPDLQHSGDEPRFAAWVDLSMVVS